MDIEKVTLSTDSGNATVPTLEYTQQLIANLVNSAPAALDTLEELADALGNDPNFATTIATALGNKLDKTGTAANASKVNNLTVQTAVPANAKFTDTTYGAATQSAAGLMSAADKKKLDGVATGANAYSLPAATSSALGGVKIGSNITNSSGTISLTKANVVAALGYTPPTSDTNTDTKVTNTVNNGAMAYVTGTTSSSTNTGTQIFDTGVYLTTTAGRLRVGSLQLGSGIILS